VFLYGFAKNERDNVEDWELDASKKLAKQYLDYNELQIAKADRGVRVERGAMR
jgi:hypothetical protein